MSERCAQVILMLTDEYDPLTIAIPPKSGDIVVVRGCLEAGGGG